MTGNIDGFKATVAKILPYAMKAKKQMLATKVTHARKTCPECGGTVHFAIGGPRNHLHMACETQAPHKKPNCPNSSVSATPDSPRLFE